MSIIVGRKIDNKEIHLNKINSDPFKKIPLQMEITKKQKLL